MSHTPGHWTYFMRTRADAKKVTGFYIKPENGYDIAELHVTSSRPREEQMANARLIAAAPKLLAACQAVLDRHNYQGTGQPWPELFRQVRAAVADAT